MHCDQPHDASSCLRRRACRDLRDIPQQAPPSRFTAASILGRRADEKHELKHYLGVTP
jgi:hypothetical protein